MCKEFNNWINELVCNIDETCDRCNGQSLTNGQFINVEDTLCDMLKDIWRKAKVYDIIASGNIGNEHIKQSATEHCKALRDALNGLSETVDMCDVNDAYQAGYIQNQDDIKKIYENI